VLGISLISFSEGFSIWELKVHCCENLVLNLYPYKHDKEGRKSIYVKLIFPVIVHIALSVEKGYIQKEHR